MIILPRRTEASRKTSEILSLIYFECWCAKDSSSPRERPTSTTGKQFDHRVCLFRLHFISFQIFFCNVSTTKKTVTFLCILCPNQKINRNRKQVYLEKGFQSLFVTRIFSERQEKGRSCLNRCSKPQSLRDWGILDIGLRGGGRTPTTPATTEPPINNRLQRG